MDSKIGFHFFVLAIILFASFIIRTYHLSIIPPGFFADEASIGYNAYTLLTKGEDENGNKFPILFQNFSTFYRPGVSVYLSAPFVLTFGLNEFSLRLASATFGTASIGLLYGLGRLLFSSKKTAILSAFFLAISPWHIHFSRINQEFIYFVFFILLSMFFFLLSIKKRNQTFLVASFISFGLSLYTYVTAYYLVPLFVFLLVLLNWRNLLKMRQAFFIGLCLLVIMGLPLLTGLRNGKTLSRFSQVSTANQGKSTAEIVTGMIGVYRDHFMPEFLFEKGDIGYHSHFITRFSVRGIGQLYWVQLPLILFGIIYAFRMKKTFLLLLGWLALYPLGSTAAPFADGGGPFAMRSIIGVVPLQLLSAAGVYYAMSFAKTHLVKVLFVFLFATIILVSFKDYLYRYFTAYPTYAADFWGWQYGSREIMDYFKGHKDNYDELFLAPAFNAPDIFIKFYDPENVCNGKCYVGDTDKFNPKRKQLFTIAADRLPSTKGFTLDIKKIISYPNGQPAFYIVGLKM